MSGARRVLRFLLIALVLALFAGTAVADEETFYCGEMFVTMPVGNGWMSLRKDDVRMMMTGISGTDGSHVGIVVFMNPREGRDRKARRLARCADAGSLLPESTFQLHKLKAACCLDACVQGVLMRAGDVG